MKTLAVTLLFLLAVGASAGAQATGPTGTWQGEGIPVTIVLRMDGTALTGTVGQGAVAGTAISEGKVENEAVTFKIQIPNGGRTITFTGTLKGDQISFTRTVYVPEGAVPGGGGILGANGPPEFTVNRVNEASMWLGTVRNAPTPRNPSPNPNPGVASLSTKKSPAPHWTWRGGEKQLEIQTFTLRNQTWELNTFELEADRLTFSVTRPGPGDTVTCRLARQPEGKFEGVCQADTGAFIQLIDLTPPGAPAKN